MEREMGGGGVLDSKVLLPHFRESLFCFEENNLF
jgi:hypothetical protein